MKIERVAVHIYLNWTRAAIIATVWFAFGIMFVREYNGDLRIWFRVFEVPVMGQPFSDLGQIPAAVESVEHGINPYVSNPYDVGRRAFIYPRIWIYLFKALRIGPSGVVAAGLAVACCFLVAVSWLIWKQQDILASAIIGLCAFSSAGAFAVERGNTDILMFCLVVVAIEIEDRGGMWLLVAAAVMKVYPLFGLLGTLGRRRNSVLVAPAILLAFAGLIAQYPDFTSRKAGDLPHGYGRKEFDIAMMQAPARLRTMSAEYWQFRTVWNLSIAMLAGSAALYGRIWAKQHKTEVDGQGGYAFMVCGSIFVGTFLVTTSYDYRLIFLLPLVPMLVNHAVSDRLKTTRILARTGLVLIVVGMNRESTAWFSSHLMTQGLKVASHVDLWALLWIVSFFMGSMWITSTPFTAEETSNLESRAHKH